MRERAAVTSIGRVAGIVIATAAIACAVTFLLLPLIAVYVAIPPATALRDLLSPAALTALGLSLRTSFAAVVFIIALGGPLAYWLSRGTFRGKRILEAMVQMPIVVPPAVAGVGLLLVFGRRGMLGPALAALHVPVAFSGVAVVMAQAFVAGPFFVVAARQAFDGVRPELVSVARTLGADPLRAFARVELPLALPGILAGAALAWARALGEFGATMLFAGNLPGVTQTLPLAIYTALDNGLEVAVAMSALLLTAAFALLLLIRLLDWRMVSAGFGRGAPARRARLQIPQEAA